MSTEEDARHAKAAKIRKQIEDLAGTPDRPADESAPRGEEGHEMKPGESPRDFIQRRMIEMKRKAPPGP